MNERYIYVHIYHITIQKYNRDKLFVNLYPFDGCLKRKWTVAV